MNDINYATGEVKEFEDSEPGAVMDLVPLDLVSLSEEKLLAMFPSPVQVAGALLIARTRIARAPKVLKDLSKAVKTAKRDLVIAKGKAYRDARQAGFNITDARTYSTFDDTVIIAQDLVDDAEIALEYGRDTRKALTTDVDILRSLNANFRAEHS